MTPYIPKVVAFALIATGATLMILASVIFVFAFLGDNISVVLFATALMFLGMGLFAGGKWMRRYIATKGE